MSRTRQTPCSCQLDYWPSLAFIGLAFLAQPAVAEQREPGFEFGLDVIHQDAQVTGFDGGSQVRMQTDYGLSAYAGYRINSRFEAQWSARRTSIRSSSAS